MGAELNTLENFSSLSRTDSSARRRSVMSTWVPTTRSALPWGSRSTARPRPRIHFQSPERVRMRYSTSKAVTDPLMQAWLALMTRARSSGWIVSAQDSIRASHSPGP